MTEPARTPVLIAGGGPIGLALALDLSWRGIRSVLVEQEEQTSPVLLAKAGTLNARTLEFCRRWGIADQVAHWGAPEDYPRDTVYCTALDGRFIGRDVSPSQRDRSPPECSPEMLQKCPQHVFDPLLARTVAAAGLCDIRYSTRIEQFTQDDDGVLVQLAVGPDGKRETLRADWLVACDGAGSAIRTALQIPFEGQTLDYSVSLMLEIDALEAFHAFGRAERFMFIGPEGTWANMTSVDFLKLWRLTLVGSEDRLDPKRLDADAVVRRAFGAARIPYVIRSIMPWRRSQCTAQSYVKGRVVLAGDSAHTTSPTGGHGLNTGLGDVVGLGWVLQAVLKGWGGPDLLEAYSQERRAIAVRNGSSSTCNYRAWVKSDADYALVDADGPAADAARARIGAQLSEMLFPEWNSLGVGLGYRYEGSPAIVPDGTPEPPDEASTVVQTSRPGHRAPHVFMADGRSTLDLFGRGFVLMRLGSGAPAGDAIVRAAASAGIPLTVFSTTEAPVVHAYERRLVLVRPDGHVAWRGDAEPQDAQAVLARVTGRRLPAVSEIA